VSGHDLGDEYAALDPAPTLVRWNGRDVRLVPLTVGKLPAFARAIRPFADRIEKIESFGAAEVLDLIADHGENLLEAVSIATGIKRGEIDDADPAALLSLIAPVIKVNADFFGRSLVPAMLSARAAMPGGGQTRSTP
jgi:hypothetical protein